MSELEDKLGAVLSNPQLMQQIMAMAQTLSSNSQQPEDPKPAPPASASLPQLDPGLLKQLSGLARHNAVDSQQQALLQALGPYLSRERVGKLERAMRAARLAGAASAFLSAGGLQALTGR